MTAAFNAAVALDTDVITNSWTSDVRDGPLSAAMQARAAAVAAAWAAGIVVVFAAGNGHWGFPGQHPDVISVGGVAIDRAGALRASDYASGFDSNLYPGRRVPDLSGLVGMRPGAQLIMLPVPPGSALDGELAGGSHPDGDETPDDDGWAAFSGTSAATPQVAGVCALLRQACSRLTPAQVREILMSTARDVTAGTNHPTFGNAAVAGPDTATGNGLVDAQKAVLLAKLRCPDPDSGPLSREDVGGDRAHDDRLADMTGEVVALAVLRPASGAAAPAGAPITADTLEVFAPDPADAEAVAAALRFAGFQVGPLVGIAMSLSGPADAFESYFEVPVREAPDGGWAAGEAGSRELPVPAELAGRVQVITFEPPAEAVTTP